jgi:hypothetical protein
MTTTYAIARLQVAGTHAWLSQPRNAPRPYLAHHHRHLFHIEVAVPVSHGDREVEILALGMDVRQVLESGFQAGEGGELAFGACSCEYLAEYIATGLAHPVAYVRVFEDGENGAEWRRD